MLQRCGLHDLFEESVPFAVLWIHETPLHMRVWSLELCWVLQAPPQFPESANVLGFSLCTAWPIPSVFQSFLLGYFFLHGMAASTCTFNFLPAFLKVSSYYLSSGSMKYIPLSLRAFSSFGFSFAHSCFSRFCAALLAEICPYFWPHMIWSCCRLNFYQSLPGPNISFRRFLFQQS